MRREAEAEPLAATGTALVDKTMNMASRLGGLADTLITTLDALVNLLAEKEAAGLDFNDPDFVAALATSANKHMTPDALNNSIGNAKVIYDAMKAGGTLNANTDDSFQALRP